MNISTTNGYSEATLTTSTFVSDFYNMGSILRARFNIEFKNRIINPHTAYWDFTYDSANLTLHYHSAIGTTLFPQALNSATDRENGAVAKLARQLEEYELSYNAASNVMSDLFKEKPAQWGFRGDPSLWQDMQHKASGLPMPSTVENLQTLLHNLFAELTGQLPEQERDIYLEKYNVGGMSKGMISSAFWLTKAFPLLIQRYIGLQHNQ